VHWRCERVYRSELIRCGSHTNALSQDIIVSNVAAGSNNFTDNTPEQVSQTRIIESVKSGSTPVRGPVKSRRKQMKGGGRGLDKRLVRPELVTAWIQRLRTTSVDPLRRFQSRRGDGDRGGDGRDQE